MQSAFRKAGNEKQRGSSRGRRGGDIKGGQHREGGKGGVCNEEYLTEGDRKSRTRREKVKGKLKEREE